MLSGIEKQGQNFICHVVIPVIVLTSLVICALGAWLSHDLVRVRSRDTDLELVTTTYGFYYWYVEGDPVGVWNVEPWDFIARSNLAFVFAIGATLTIAIIEIFHRFNVVMSRSYVYYRWIFCLALVVNISFAMVALLTTTDNTLMVTYGAFTSNVGVPDGKVASSGASYGFVWGMLVLTYIWLIISLSALAQRIKHEQELIFNYKDVNGTSL